MKESDRQIFFDVNTTYSSTETDEEISGMFDDKVFPEDSLGGGDFLKLEEELKKVRSIKKP
ncbi:ECU06_0935 [Encephalitozoon cuniculi GB-M1]|uniref:ECU06_0935 protein n=1 Tax=Encephalitozoon cuniculi (strain GB-M1) TaxID=284813 RepID=I7L4G3_ENCCU|nr:uncharacterized protein ECU06_0935 [Encephalitozoon cuniculi GB-M1]UYI27685.1 hypothetical protein J0A71_07g15650 [Encephalitozoon cuniculi]CCI73945.1 ECU06_0935 [Encephalitozoon cuniculi GB-M1]